MSLYYHRAPNVEVGTAITSRDYNLLMKAINDRLGGGAGDPSYRILWYVHSLFRNMLNRYNDTDFPDEDEWWKLWSNLDGKYAALKGITWPQDNVSNEGGLNLSNVLNAFLFGQGNLLSEPGRMNSIPTTLPAITKTQGQSIFPLYFYPTFVSPSDADVNSSSFHGTTPHAPITPAEQWLVGLLQRGAVDPATGLLSAPAYSAPRIFDTFRGSSFSPYKKSYEAYAPQPEVLKYCWGNLDDPPYPVYKYIFTSLVNGATIHLNGGCQFEPNTVQQITETSDSYLIYMTDGTGNVIGLPSLTDSYSTVVKQPLKYNEWIQGPYTAGGALVKGNGAQIDEALNYFSMNFRGTTAQRNSTTECYNVRDKAFIFEKFFTTQYLLAPALGIHYTVTVDGHPTDQIAEVYPSWKLTAGAYLAHKIFDTDVVTAVANETGVETISHLSNTIRTLPSGFQVTGMYIYGENLTTPFDIDIVSGSNTTTITLTPDAHQKINQINILNATDTINPTGTYSIKMHGDYTIPSTGYITVVVLEQLQMKPGLPDVYTVLRMASCSDNVSNAGIDMTGPEFTRISALVAAYDKGGYIPALNGIEMDPYDGDGQIAINPRAIYEAARSFFNQYVRLASRDQLTGYEVINDGGTQKSILYFQRFAWPAGSEHNIPPAVLNGISIKLPKGEVNLAELASIDVPLNGVAYLLVKTGNQAPNTELIDITPQPLTRPNDHPFTFDIGIYRGTQLFPYTVGSHTGVFTGNTSLVGPTYATPIVIGTGGGRVDHIDWSITSEFERLYRNDVSGLLGDGDIGFNLKIEQQTRDISDTVITAWTVIGDSFIRQETDYFWQQSTSGFGPTVNTVELRYTGIPRLRTSNNLMKVFKQVQTGLAHNKTYVVRGNPTVFEGSRNPVTEPVGVIYNGVTYGLDQTFETDGVVTDYTLVTGREHLLLLVLTGIQNGHKYLVKTRAAGYVTYPAGSTHHYHEGETFIGTTATDYTISNYNVDVYDITVDPSAATLRQGFDTFYGLAPSRDSISLNGVLPGIVYKVAGSIGSIEYNGTPYAIGETFTGITDVVSFTKIGLVTSVEVFPLTGGVWSAAPKKGYSNEWQLSLSSNHYHPSETSEWNPTTYGDEIGFLHNRCHTYSKDLASRNHANLLNQFAYGNAPVIRSEAPSGYTYLEQTNNAAVEWEPCDEVESAARCNKKNSLHAKDYYRSCQIYKPDYQIESVELTDIDGEVKVKLTSRLQHCPTAPSTVARNLISDAALRGEPYRTDENIVREYLRCIQTGCTVLTNPAGVQCSQYKIGDYPPASYLPHLTDNPFGACFPRVYFLKKLPYVYAEPGEPGTEAAVLQPAQDTRRDVDPFLQAEFYLRAMCGGFLDRYSTLNIGNCLSTSGTSKLVDFTMDNLIYQATRAVGGSIINPTVAEVLSAVPPDVTVSTSNYVTWAPDGAATSYDVKRRTILSDNTFPGTYTTISTITDLSVHNYVDSITSTTTANPSVLAAQYQVIAHTAGGDHTITPTVTSFHNIGWYDQGNAVYRVYRRTRNTSNVVSAWTELLTTGSNYSLSIYNEEYEIVAPVAEVQYKVAAIVQFAVSWTSTTGQEYIVQRKVNRAYDGDVNWVEVADITAGSSGTTSVTDVPNLSENLNTDALQSVVDILEDFATVDTTFSSTEVTHGTNWIITNDDNTHTLVWPTVGSFPTYTVYRHYTYLGVDSGWVRLARYLVNSGVVSDPDSGLSSFNDPTVLDPELYSNIGYTVRYNSTALATTYTFTPDAQYLYTIDRESTMFDGRVVLEAVVPATEGGAKVYAPDTTPIVIDDPLGTPSGGVATIRYKVSKLIGHTINWGLVPSNNPSITYQIIRSWTGDVDGGHPDGKYSLTINPSVGVFTYDDDFTFKDSDISYRVLVTLQDPVLSAVYRVITTTKVRARSISMMPSSKRPDNPTGYGPYPNTCSMAAMFNTYSNAVNLLVQARVDLPFIFQCKTIGRAGTTFISADWIAPEFTTGTATASTFCGGNPAGTIVSTFNGSNRQPSGVVIGKRGVPISMPSTVTLPGEFADCSGTLVSSAETSMDGQKVLCPDKFSVANSSSETSYRIVQEQYSFEALPDSLKPLFNPSHLGFYGLKTTLVTKYQFNPSPGADEAAQKANATPLASTTLHDSSIWLVADLVTVEDSTSCEFFTGGTIKIPQLEGTDCAYFQDPLLSGPTGIGVATATTTVTIPNLTQFVAILTIPTV